MFDYIRDAFDVLRARWSALRPRTAFGLGALVGLGVGLGLVFLAVLGQA